MSKEKEPGILSLVSPILSREREIGWAEWERAKQFV